MKSRKGPQDAQGIAAIIPVNLVYCLIYTNRFTEQYIFIKELSSKKV